MISLMINLIAKVTTQHDVFPFNSMVKFGNKYLGASDDGLFTIGGSLENELPIGASFTLFSTDFGTPNNKRLRNLYYRYESDGDLEVRVTVDDDPERSEVYPIPQMKLGQQRVTVPVGRNLHGCFWKIETMNTRGCDFSIDAIDALVNDLGHGRR